MLAIWSPGNLTPLLLLGGAVPAAGAGAYALRRPEPIRGARLITDSSVATVIVAVGVAVAMVGITAGLWLALVGAEITAFGLGGVLRELRASGRGHAEGAER
jgi:hypothetical protein